MDRVLVISDLQEPFSHPLAYSHIKDTYKSYNCNRIVLIGDELDFKFLKYADVNDPHTAEQQHELAISKIKQLYDWFPDADLVKSNHVHDRINYISTTNGIPKFMLKDVHNLLRAPKGWKWHDRIKIDGVNYEHGHLLKGGKQVAKQGVLKRQSSVVFGHYPLFEIRYTRLNENQFFGMCVGAMVTSANCERMGYGMTYSRIYDEEIPLGLGVVYNGKWPYLVPLYE